MENQYSIIEIYYANSPRACIKYKGNIPYSWCVSRNDASNMYYTYRMKEHEPAFYFVKIIDRTKKELGLWNIIKSSFNGEFKDKYHFFVVQVIINANIDNQDQEQYLVTSAMNDGDQTMSWNDLLKIEPRLDGLQKYFQPQALTSEESEIYDRFSDGISNKEFCKLSYEFKRKYLDIYVRINKNISDEQFECMPDDLKNLYISFGVGLTIIQYNSIKNNPKLLKRYKEIAQRMIEQFNSGNLDDYYVLLPYLNSFPELINSINFDLLKPYHIAGLMIEFPHIINDTLLNKIKNDESSYSRLIAVYPQFINKFEINNLHHTNSAIILSKQPQFIDKFNLTKFDSDDISTVLMDQPELIYHFDFDAIWKMKSIDTRNILYYQPQLIDELNIYRLTSTHIDMLIDYNPKLKQYFKNKNLI